MKVGLYLMTSKGLPVLNRAIEAGLEIVHVTTAPATGMQDSSHAVIAATAKGAGIPCFTRAHPPQYTADYSIAAGWRWMLDMPGQLIVLHDSLLPRYRGFAPMITALVNGEREIGVTAFFAGEPGEGYDTGPVIDQRVIQITYPIRANEAIIALEQLYGDIAEDIFHTLKVQKQPRYVHQDERQASYSIWRDEEDFHIDWRKDDRSIIRLIDAASHPFSGAWTWGAKMGKVVVHAAEVIPDVRFAERHPGKVHMLEGGPQVVCGVGMIRVTSSTPYIENLRTRLQ